MVLSRDFVSGLAFLLLGAGLAWKAQDYQMGTLFRMGPGYFPTIIGAGIVLVGVALMIKGLISRTEPFPHIAMRPVIFLLGAIVVFSLSLDRIGLVISTFLLIGIGRFASTTPLSWIKTLILSAVLAAGAVFLFRDFLSLPLKIWP